ncbi:hypothetical protein PoB_006187500 [Plakobranchus ocellatus]|uniref:Uncharacterized protein n=1 Tax=Plakobranchus ocellatus TaxID=259542 RepID=A0AAV4CTZ9_9GAST|nr:hypothetical protein PoB_006187500 [Plakobranchus ocellatus]
MAAFLYIFPAVYLLLVLYGCDGNTPGQLPRLETRLVDIDSSKLVVNCTFPSTSLVQLQTLLSLVISKSPLVGREDVDVEG